MSRIARAVVSTIGHDRPGLVSDLTSIAERLALNIEDSRMTVLGGEFAVLMAVTGEASALEAFDAALAELCKGDELAYIFRPTGERGSDVPARPYTATVVALDHPGIVAAIARFFSKREINIRDLTTSQSPAPHTGTPIFNVTLVAEVPATVKVRELRDAFEAFCDEADLDGKLEAER